MNRSDSPPVSGTPARHLPLAVMPQLIEQLTPDPRNARLHPPKHVKQLAASIAAFGFNVPLLVDKAGQVIAGHGRLLAAKQLGWTEVPTITLEHLSPLQVQAYRIADNRLTDCSSWDEQLLGEQLRDLSAAELDFDLEAIGFDLPEIDFRIQNLGGVGDDPEEAQEQLDVGAPVVTRLGDVWQLGRHRIVCGSALEPSAYETLLQGQRVGMVFCDPPYNVKVSSIGGKGSIRHREFAMASGELSIEQFTTFLSTFLGAARQACGAGALLYVCMDWRHLGELSDAGDAQQLELKNLCVWDKGCGGMGSLYRSQHELIFVFKAGDAPHTNNVQLGKFGRNRTNVWNYPGINSFARNTGEGNLLELHPTVKPVALVADAILDASERADIVLDPFLGSGTTLIASEKTGRTGMGIELDPRYVDVAIRRWQRLTGLPAHCGVTGRSFDEVSCSRSSEEVSAVALELEGAA